MLHEPPAAAGRWVGATLAASPPSKGREFHKSAVETCIVCAVIKSYKMAGRVPWQGCGPALRTRACHTGWRAPRQNQASRTGP
ncbi:hypothetical protein CBM2589_B30119 [Cupriavidus taiwanensis]|uniref:Uncharacterized protein n=1 Tax=Cupriavidus taiwanensis TaxID=164546 RepID=A0A975X2P0_9BURK|nr:hypothetical protein CBM2589_B30119 [Cupriavidus taiwanensis]